MKKKICLAVCVILLLNVLFVSGVGAAEDTVSGEEYETEEVIDTQENSSDESTQTEENLPEEDKNIIKVCENENFVLYINIADSQIKITDKKGDCVWTTAPSKELIEMHSLSETSQLLSLLRVSFMDKTRNLITVASYDNCIMNNSFEIKTVKEDGKVKGVKLIYNFPNKMHDFKVPFTVVLDGDSVKVEVLFDEIEENGSSKISQIEVLPYFSAASGEDDGYLFIPDGSGALVDFSKRYKKADDYSDTVYGRDAAVNINKKDIEHSGGIKMPCFGMRKNGKAYFAIIEKGDALSEICATSSDMRYMVSSVWSRFNFRECDITGLMTKDSVIRQVRMIDGEKSSVNPVVSYRFLHGEDADYVGMAKTYQKYLVKKYGLKKLKEDISASPFIELFGMSNKQKYFLGIPYTADICATSFDDAVKINESLEKAGVKNPVYAMYGFSTDGYNNRYVNKKSFDSKVGGNKGFEKFIKAVGKNRAYFGYGIIRNYGASDKFYKGSKYVKGLNQLTLMREEGQMSTGTARGTRGWLYLDRDSVKSGSQKLLDSFENKDKCGIIYQDMGNEVYGNFDEDKGFDRQQMLETYTGVLENSAKKTSVAADGANIYMLAGSKLMTEVPLTAGNHDIITESVPFYFITLGGYVNMTSTPINIVDDRNSTIDFCAQFGIMPTWRITECSADKLKGTSLNFLYDSKFKDNKNSIVKGFERAARLREKIGKKEIKEYTVNGKTSTAVYTDGSTLCYDGENFEFK